jgi:hypothetical protein
MSDKLNRQIKTMSEIQSIGLPPARHADRVVAEMMRALAIKHGLLWEAMQMIIKSSSDGSPKSQQKMARRIEQAGAGGVVLRKSGKRGRYELFIFDILGWNLQADKPIMVDDLIPERPWIVCHLTQLKSRGGGADRVVLKSRPILFLTHHVLSRTAQRMGARTGDDLMNAIDAMLAATMTLMQSKGFDNALVAPPAGWRVPIGDEAMMVLQPHETHRALVAVTVITNREELK